MPNLRTLTARSVLMLALTLSPAGLAVSQDSSDKKSDVDVRYFQKKLELAQHDLEAALDANRDIPNLNSKLTLLRLQNQVEYSKKLLDHATNHGEHDLHSTHLQNLKNDLALAEQQYRWSKEANQKYAGVVSTTDVKRLKLAVELARLALERAEQPEITEDPTSHLQWQVDRLRSELLKLTVEFERVRSGH
ncbi:hypothetical protein [Novipirellula artificiosorum]|uniref:Outer membrane efflux protein n=1 Tax=Novipirellula artificiosorum TaxID=2528016 RepID=A0A5C6DRZ3_9BACT|nr:hypothetical protein [Novipirellula artificiosorum]TWU39442.1 hypothetical protein Poly41_22660 [Novipirellula artificiosorum]